MFSYQDKEMILNKITNKEREKVDFLTLMLPNLILVYEIIIPWVLSKTDMV